MVHIDKQSDKPIYLQLYQALKHDITENNQSQEPLTPIRVLAKELCISKNTVNMVYQQLLAEGYIYSVPGSGYYRNNIGTAIPPKVTVPVNIPAPNISPKIPKYNFAYGTANAKSVSWANWKKCVNNALLFEEASNFLVYECNQGYYPLRKVLVEYLKASRGVDCTPEQIIICSGVHSAMEIVAALLPPSKYTLGFEEPGYNGTRNIFRRYDYKINPISVSRQGISLPDLSQSDCNLVYVTPSHQFPTGCVLPIANRYKLLELMDNRQGYIIEDDYDSEFHYNSMAIPSLQSLDTCDRVIYTSSFSKTISPTLRVGYLVLPRQLLALYHDRYFTAKNPVPGIIQRALYEFMESGYYATHLRKLVLANEKKFNYVIKLFGENQCPHIMPVAINAGLYMLLRITTHHSHEELLKLLDNNDIRLYTTSLYWMNRASWDSSLYTMGFASLEMKDIREGIMRLCQVLNSPEH